MAQRSKNSVRTLAFFFPSNVGSATLRRQVRPLPPIFATVILGSSHYGVLKAGAQQIKREMDMVRTVRALYPKKDGTYRPSAKLLVCLSVPKNDNTKQVRILGIPIGQNKWRRMVRRGRYHHDSDKGVQATGLCCSLTASADWP